LGKEKHKSALHSRVFLSENSFLHKTFIYDILYAVYALINENIQKTTCKSGGDMIEYMRWRCILVKAFRFEEGPKNPLKGISMKSLVLAFFAQIRVGAGG
jgi:hypothetical protein